MVRFTFKLGLFSFFSISLVYYLASCKKPNPNPNPTPPVNTKAVYQDTLLNISRETYYWNENIPKTFNPLSYQVYIAATDSSPLTEAIKLFSPLNPANKLHYDHFSFLLTTAEYNSLFVTGATKRFGMNFSQDRNGIWRVAYVAHASPAYSMGIRRGFQLNSVNGNTLSATTSSSQLSVIDNILQYNSTASFVFTPTGSTSSLTLQINQGNFGDDECIATKVVKSGTKVIGYIAYNTFLTQFSNTQGALHPGLDTAFSGLAAKGITDLIIDLRYNGGGYTSVAEQMDNAMIPLSQDGQIMYSETFNDSLNIYHKAFPKEGFPGDTTIYISKTNPDNPAALSLNNIVFIVSNETTSAAELLINNLYPYFTNLKLVGLGKSYPQTQQNTGGKPFGYAGAQPIPLNNPIYYSFLINFESKNSLGQDNYVSGFVPNVQVYDGLEYNWGDPNEDGYKAAFNYLSTGSFSVNSSGNFLSLGRNVSNSSGNARYFMKLRDSKSFYGMIKTPVKGKKFSSLTYKLNKAKFSLHY